MTGLQAGDGTLHTIGLSEVAFLFLVGRIDAIVLDSADPPKDASRLKAAGIPETIFC